MTHKLLLADDSVTIQKVVELTFSEEDFSIVAVGDGATALQKIRADRPDVILSDVIMPGMNGYDLCATVKGDEKLRDIPFLFLKGTFESFDEERASAVGADGFIVKPFESQELVARVKELVSRPRAVAPAPPPPSPPTPEPPLVVPEEPVAAAFASDFTGPVGYGTPAPPAVELPATVGFGGGEEGIEEDLWSEVKVSDHPIPQSLEPEPLAGQGFPGEEPRLEEEIFPLEPPTATKVPGFQTPAAPVSEPRPAPPPPPPPPSAIRPELPRFEIPSTRSEPAAPPIQPATVQPQVPPVTAEGVEKLVAQRVEAVLREIAPAIIREVTRQVVSEVAWEVVPEAAERLVRQEIERLTGRGSR